MISFVLLMRRFLRAVRSALKNESFRGLFILVLIMFTTGTIFYSSVEHWSLLDSLYFSVISLVTVGYGDLTPHSAFGKVFTMVYVLLGVGIIFGAVNILAHHAVEDARQKTKLRKIRQNQKST